MSNETIHAFRKVYDRPIQIDQASTLGYSHTFTRTCPPVAQTRESRPLGLFGRLRRAVAIWLYPDFREKAVGFDLLQDALDQVKSTRDSLAAYRDLLKECEHQRQIDIDARHLCMGECDAWRLKYEELLSKTSGWDDCATDEKRPQNAGKSGG